MNCTPPPLDPVTQATATVAKRFYELCSTDKHHEAMQELYADNARHIEVMEMPGSPYKRITEGKPALLKMSEHWAQNTEVHGGTCSKPLINGDQFIVDMSIDATHKQGPMAGQRMNMTEKCLYTVKNGKITEAKFFYCMEK